MFLGGGKHLFSRRWRFRKATLQGAARCNNAGRMLARRTNRARCVSNALWQGARQSGSVVRNRAPRRRGRRTHKLRGGKHVRPGNEAAGHGPPPGGAAAASWASAGPPLRPAEAPPASNAAPDPWCPPPGRPDRRRQPPPHAPPLRGPPTRPFSGCPPRRGGGSRAQKPPPNSSGPSSRPPRRHRAARPCKPAPTGRGGRRAGAPPPRGTGPRCRRNGYQSRPSPPQPCTPEPPQKPAPRPAAPSGPTADQLRQLTPHKTRGRSCWIAGCSDAPSVQASTTASPRPGRGPQGSTSLRRIGSEVATSTAARGNIQFLPNAPGLKIAGRPPQHQITHLGLVAGHVQRRAPPPPVQKQPSQARAHSEGSWPTPQAPLPPAWPAATPHPPTHSGGAPPAGPDHAWPTADWSATGTGAPSTPSAPGQSNPAGGCQPAPPPRGLASGPSGGPTPASRPRPAPPRYPPSQEPTSPRTLPRQ